MATPLLHGAATSWGVDLTIPLPRPAHARSGAARRGVSRRAVLARCTACQQPAWVAARMREGEVGGGGLTRRCERLWADNSENNFLRKKDLLREGRRSRMGRRRRVEERKKKRKWRALGEKKRKGRGGPKEGRGEGANHHIPAALRTNVAGIPSRFVLESGMAEP
uniref:Uncharacterized protein n=1 Tax=Oryza punctata TaxID=4537 RepID=A0A0E0MLC0_ORYPU